jgi:hypothetical protein
MISPFTGPLLIQRDPGSHATASSTSASPESPVSAATGSTAIGAIPTSTTLNGVQVCPRTDQQGVASVGNCTIGAVEVALCATGLTPRILNAAYANGNFMGLFCVKAERPQGRFGVRFGDQLLGGATNGTKSGFVELAPGESDRDVHVERDGPSTYDRPSALTGGLVACGLGRPEGR